jgi:hypothetical protein
MRELNQYQRGGGGARQHAAVSVPSFIRQALHGNVTGVSTEVLASTWPSQAELSGATFAGL